MLPVGVLTRLIQPIWPFHIPAEYGGVYICMCDGHVDERESAPLGITARPVTDTVADTVRWLYQRGLLSQRQAGRAAAAEGAWSR
jgi:prepilin-type processing-associated H-X9-DG protein